jgi:tripartite-type tricarboxylate transporter receptor subunit TctC
MPKPSTQEAPVLSLRLLSALVALALAALSAVPAPAQTYPARPIKLMVPFPAGGATDTSARLVAQGMSARLGQQVVIENQGGAGGTIGSRQVAQAAPDGYTLLMVAATNTFGIIPLLYKLDFEPQKAFVPVAMAVVEKQVMVVNPSLPVKTLAELVAYAKANPGKLNYGNAVGIAPHFLVELFKRKAGVDIVHVPYRGGAPMIADLLGGQIQMTINGKSVLLPHIREGKLRPLAVTSAIRWPELPELPSLVEGGYLASPYDTLFGVVAPTGTPAAAIDKLNAAVNDALASAELRASFARLGIEPKSGSPADFAAAIAPEAAKWAEIVRVTGIKAAE